jgi:class 3 adenylate cyclase
VPAGLCRSHVAIANCAIVKAYLNSSTRVAPVMAQTRRLAAILAADVAGYSRLIEADEGGTLQALRTIRAELLDPTIAAHNGRLVKTTGDGLLVEFGSVVDALRCATVVQAGMAGRNVAAPADKRMVSCGLRVFSVSVVVLWG